MEPGRNCMNGTFLIRNSHFFRFREDDYILENLDANAVKLALNNWEARAQGGFLNQGPPRGH